MFSYNISTTYVLPLLNNYVPLKYRNNIKTTFLLNELYENELGECLFIVYEYDNIISNDDGFPLYENELLKNDYVEGIYDIYDGKYIVVIVKIPHKLNTEIIKFLNGKYSEFSESSKKEIIKYWVDVAGTKNTVRINQILNKSEALRLQMEIEYDGSIPKGSELGNIWNLEKETFKLKLK